MSVREKQKRETKNKILKSGRTIFSKKGYQETTISEIANQVEIAEGTIYNYFDSKGEILITIFSNLFFHEDYEFSEIEKSPAVKEEIVNFLDFYFKPLKKIDNSLLREIFILHFRQKKEGEFKAFEDIDRSIFQEIELYLRKLQKKKIIIADLNIDKWSDILYDVCYYNYSSYLMNPEKSFEEFFKELKEQVEYLINSTMIISEDYEEG